MRQPRPPENCLHPLESWMRLRATMADPSIFLHELPSVTRYAQGAARDELIRRDEARKSRGGLRALALLIFDDFVLGEWIQEVFDALDQFIEDVEKQRSPRLMIFAPPRHGKSHVVSRLLAAYILGTHPSWEVVAASSSQDLANEFGLFVRNTLNDPVFSDIYPGCVVDPATNAVDRITTLAMGGYRAIGVGGTIVGRGAHVLIIDDPIKGKSEAFSSTEREKLHGWYRSNARTRLSPGGGIVLMHQRWHPDDLAGRLRRSDEDTSSAQPRSIKWKVLSFPAVLPDGEALFPERWSLKLLRDIEADLTPSEWRAMYMQEPVTEEGGFFKADWFQFYSALPSTDELVWYIGCDLATSKSSKANLTAIIPVAFHAKTAMFYVAPDYILARMTSVEMADALFALAEKYNVKSIMSEKGACHNMLMPVLATVMAKKQRWFHITEVSRPDGKNIMAAAYQAELQSRRIYFPNNRLTTGHLIPQHLNFIEDADNAEDDGIDAIANLFLGLKGKRPKAQEPTPPAPEPTEDEIWERILARGPGGKPDVPFTRFNGLTFQAAAGH